MGADRRRDKILGLMGDVLNQILNQIFYHLFFCCRRYYCYTSLHFVKKSRETRHHGPL